MDPIIVTFSLLSVGLIGVLSYAVVVSTKRTQAAWQRFADTIGAAYTKKRFGSPIVIAMARRWQVTIDVYSESSGEDSIAFTRVTIPYAPARPFFLLLQPRPRTPRFIATTNARLLERQAAKMPEPQRQFAELAFRGEDIPFGDAELDGKYMLRSTDPDLARRLFAQPSVRRLLSEQKSVTIAFKPPPVDGKSPVNTGGAVLEYQQIGFLSSMEALRSAFDLTVAVIEEADALRIASALAAQFLSPLSR